MGRKPKRNIYWDPMPNEYIEDHSNALVWDVVPVETCGRVRVEILGHAEDERISGVCLSVYAGDGGLRCGAAAGWELLLWPSDAGARLDSRLRSIFDEVLALEYSATGDTFVCDVDAPEGLLTVQRIVWEPPGGGNPASLFTETDYSAMLVELDGEARRYHCNAGSLDDPFDRLVFSLVPMPDAPSPG
jgi:hypothetical protein